MIRYLEEGAERRSYVSQLFSFLFDGDVAHKYLGVMFYQGYIDDSADRNRERVVISGAVLGKPDDWRYLTKYWSKRLKRDGIEYFKSSHCNHLRGPFFKFVSQEHYPPPKGREAADRIRRDLDKIIEKSSLCSIGIVIPIQVYQRMKQEPKYSSFLPTDPYHWAVQSVWRESSKMLREELRGKHVVSFAHDDSDNFHVLHKLFLDYKRQNPKDSRVLRDFVPLDDKVHPPVQAADAVADITSRYAEEWAINPSPANLKRLRSTMYKICVWTEDYARAVLDQMTASRIDANADGTESAATKTEKNAAD